MKAHIIAVATGALLALSVTAADACSRKVSSKAASTEVPEARIDQKLLDQAVRVEVNYHRCRAGLSPVKDTGRKMNGIAESHSKWMAKTKKLSHNSTVSGKQDLTKRLKASGLKFRTGSENIGMVHRYQIDKQRFKIVSAQQCQFTTMDGAPLPAHSYASLARHIVDLWMASPGHRTNILSRDVNRTTVGTAFTGNAQHCGQFWSTQNFVG